MCGWVRGRGCSATCLGLTSTGTVRCPAAAARYAGSCQRVMAGQASMAPKGLGEIQDEHAGEGESVKALPLNPGTHRCSQPPLPFLNSRLPSLSVLLLILSLSPSITARVRVSVSLALHSQGAAHRR